MRESGPLKGDEDGDEEGDVDEDDHRGDGSPGGTPARLGEKGREAPLRLAPPWPPPLMGRDSPLWSLVSMAAEGQEPLLDWISLSVLFCFAFLFSSLSLFLKFPEIRNSDCAEILTRFFPGY